MSEVKSKAKARVITVSQQRSGLVSNRNRLRESSRTIVAKKAKPIVVDEIEEEELEGTYVPEPVRKIKTSKPEIKTIRDDLEESDEEDLGYKVKKIENSAELISRTKEILERMDAERELNGVSDDSTYEFYRAALIDTLELVPIARRAFTRYQSQSNAYSYNALVTKCQELIADMQALSDKSNLLQRLLDKSILPSYMLIIGNLANSFSLVTVEIQGMGLEKEDEKRVTKLFSQYTRGLGQFLQDSQNALVQELKGEMSEED